MTEASIFYYFPNGLSDEENNVQLSDTFSKPYFIDTIGGKHVNSSDSCIHSDELENQKIIFRHYERPQHIVTAHEFDGRFSGESLVEPVKAGRVARFRIRHYIYEISHSK